MRHVIRGMGLYTPDDVDPIIDARNWEMPGDGHPEPVLRELAPASVVVTAVPAYGPPADRTQRYGAKGR